MSKQYYNASNYSVRESVGYLIRRSNGLIMSIMEPIFGDQGFTFTQYMVLSWLRDGLATTASELCNGMCHDSGALTRVIDQLAERGLIERVRGANDRRKVDLRLTVDGHAAIERLIPVVVDQLNLALADFSLEEVHELVRMLTKLNGSLLTRRSASNPSSAEAQ